MFEDTLVPNDLQIVCNVIDAYYQDEITPTQTTEETI
jgi:hypothetical protein